MTQAERIRPGQFELSFTEGVMNGISESEAMKQAVSEAVARFSFGDWGNIEPEDAEANNSDLKAHSGRILARYPSPEGDLYITLYFDETGSGEDRATVMYCREY